jgi:hypothetical protein
LAVVPRIHWLAFVSLSYMLAVSGVRELPHGLARPTRISIELNMRPLASLSFLGSRTCWLVSPKLTVKSSFGIGLKAKLERMERRLE